ncbi:hypothetical protein NM688_g1088 [Phlebia brevispora]|uniref:Uncharacterized protein n=1 Tax=Phlebia brevispora TaxID=194682 RepID=A0ACC1TC59_9APHY|nr:hypothetical protein NM688_g1088 [Phlebia brevispora]
MTSLELSAIDLQEILEFTTALARRAGDLILTGSQAILSSGNVDEKKNSVDLVTEYDVKVEELVKGELSKKYAGFKFIGEESYAAGSREPLTEDPTFCVDPIDGTTNFVHGFPYACVSIGLIYKKSPVLGVIYNPFHDQLPLPSLSQALIGIEWGSDRSANIIRAKGEAFKRLAGNPKEGVEGGRMAHSLRSVGSAALNYAMVAQGGLDLYWEIGCWPWDICAGSIIAQEAGGFVAGSNTAPLDNHITEEVLVGRKYIVVRAIGDTATESGLDAQKRIIKEFYQTVEDWQPQ